MENFKNTNHTFKYNRPSKYVEQKSKSAVNLSQRNKSGRNDLLAKMRGNNPFLEALEVFSPSFLMI